MSFGGLPQSFMVIIAGTMCIVLSWPVSMALGISETIPILLGVVIMIIGAPITLHMDRNTFGAMPPCMLFGFTGFIILFGGMWISFPSGSNPLASVLVILGILQAVVGSSLGTLYIRRLRKGDTKPLWSRSIEQGLDQMESILQRRVESKEYEDQQRKEQVVVREVLLRQRLPLECDNCGAPIDPEKIDWIGPDTIKCSSCGTSLRAETERV